MDIFHSEKHHLHFGVELNQGRLIAAFETPSRVDIILGSLLDANLGEVKLAQDFGLGPILKVHDLDYVEFLRTSHERWRDSGHEPHDHLVPQAWPPRGVRRLRIPGGVQGEMNYYASDASASIMGGTWLASLASANVAVAAADAVLGGSDSAFALCRPPGHHASRDQLGGYCYLNNAAIAAQWLVDRGMRRVAILDVDYHHGHGTQAIFYDRADVLFASLHGHPSTTYPYFQGYEDEVGEGEGEGANWNIPLPRGTMWGRYAQALDTALDRVAGHAADVLVVSLGVDTFEGDPVGGFLLKSADFRRLGEQLASAELPTLFVLEGGYATRSLGTNIANVLTGFLETGSVRVGYSLAMPI